MKRRLITLGIMLSIFSPQMIKAQVGPALTLPVSPAFSILNFEPSAIMRPTNAKSVASDMLNAFDKDGKLLMNLGFEVAPYWLTSHPNLNHETYQRPNLKQTLLQSLSLSAATVKDSASGRNKLGAGFRLKLYNGEPVKESIAASNRLASRTTVVSIINGLQNVVGPGLNSKEKVMGSLLKSLVKKDIDEKIIEDVKRDAESLSPSYTDSETDIKLFLQALLDKRIKAYDKLAALTSELLYVRKGWIIELAGASSFNASNHNTFERAGFWANATYALTEEDMFTLTTRYMARHHDSSMNNLDAGLGFLKKTDSYNISIECMMRYYSAGIPDTNLNHQPIVRKETSFTYRLAAQGSYLIGKNVSINLSLGKDFNSPFVATSGFFSILGLNYSIFGKKPEAEQ